MSLRCLEECAQLLGSAGLAIVCLMTSHDSSSARQAIEMAGQDKGLEIGKAIELKDDL